MADALPRWTGGRTAGEFWRHPEPGEVPALPHDAAGRSEQVNAGLSAEDTAHLSRAIDARLRRELAEFTRVLLRDAEEGGPPPTAPDAPGAIERRHMRAFLGDEAYLDLLRCMQVLRGCVVRAHRIRLGELTLDSALRVALGRFDVRAYGQELAPREHAARLAGWALAGTPARAAMAAYWERQQYDFALKLLRSFLDPMRGENRLRATFRVDE